jgi:hypothetical protein
LFQYFKASDIACMKNGPTAFEMFGSLRSEQAVCIGDNTDVDP